MVDTVAAISENTKAKMMVNPITRARGPRRPAKRVACAAPGIVKHLPF
jgi:hypothetical protein